MRHRTAITISLPAVLLTTTIVTAHDADAPREAFPETMIRSRFARPAAEPVTAGRPDLFLPGLNTFDLGAVAAARIAEADLKREQRFGHIAPGPKRVGFVREANLRIEDHGRDGIANGMHVRTMRVRSPGAFHTRLHITGLDVGLGTLVVYAYAGDELVAHGPYTGRGPKGNGTIWTPALPGADVFIEVSGAETPTLTIEGIVHMDHNPHATAPMSGGTPNPANLLCHLDAMCEAVNVDARNATGRMSFVEDGTCYVCTGTLMNDLDPTTNAPYFLTAYHCMSEQVVVDTLQVTWFYENDICGGTLPNFSLLPNNIGGTLLETSETILGNDMCFIRLDGPLPAGITFAGWTTASLQNGHGIHHPGGSWKRASWFTDSSGACLGALQYDYYELIFGAIEGGSSGSGIFNAQGQLSGQLYGWCGVTDTPVCADQQDSPLQYGEWEETLEDVEYWIVDLGGTIHVNHANSGAADGTLAAPFSTVTAGHDYAWNGTRLAIAPGYYQETLTLTKQMTIVSEGGVVQIGP